MANPFANATEANPLPATVRRGSSSLRAGDKVYVYFTSGDYCSIYPEGGSPNRGCIGGVHCVDLAPLPHPADEFEDNRLAWNEEVLRLAEKYERTATFQYEKKSGPGGIIELRSLRPDSIRPNKQGDLVVYGEDGDRHEIRGFRLDRIVGYVSVAGGRR